MTELGMSASLAKLSARLTEDSDVATTAHETLRFCALLGADAAAVLVRPASGDLEVLASSSHTAHLLELYQVMCGDGPCVECISSGHTIVVDDPAVFTTRWPDAGAAIVNAGISCGLALPLTWRGVTFGGLNVFFTDTRELSEELVATAQGAADLLTIAILHANEAPNSGRIYAALQSALDNREIIEQAKGVIAQQDAIEVSEAYDRLISRAQETDAPITAAAHRAVELAELGDRWNSATPAPAGPKAPTH